MLDSYHSKGFVEAHQSLDSFDIFLDFGGVLRVQGFSQGLVLLKPGHRPL